MMRFTDRGGHFERPSVHLFGFAAPACPALMISEPHDADFAEYFLYQRRPYALTSAATMRADSVATSYSATPGSPGQQHPNRLDDPRGRRIYRVYPKIYAGACGAYADVLLCSGAAGARSRALHFRGGLPDVLVMLLYSELFRRMEPVLRRINQGRSCHC